MLAPADLVARAAANGVELLALTDHDDVSGLAEAADAAAALGVKFIGGVEISVTWRDTAIHIVGLGIDADDAALRQGLASIRCGRGERAQRMADALSRVGIRDAMEGATRLAGDARVLSRTHFARFLVEQGIAGSVHAVFDHYLVRGKPGYVTHQWALLEQALAWISGAGGIAVTAHPGRYRLSREALQQFFADFKRLGGTGIEVMSGSHSSDQSRAFARVARKFGFLASCGSDFHAPGESPVDLGGTAPLPQDLAPVWSRLV